MHVKIMFLVLSKSIAFKMSFMYTYIRFGLICRLLLFPLLGYSFTAVECSKNGT